MSIAQKATNSLIWSAVERFSVQGIQFLLGIVIARLLLPSDYGLIAMLNVFMAIAQTFVDSGFASALIQKNDCQEKDYSTVFYFNIAVSVLLYFFMYMVSPWIASFYQEPKLEIVTKVVGLSLIINSLGIVQQARFTIGLDFKRLAFVSLWSVVVSGVVGVYMAYVGWGVWALVSQTLMFNLMRVLLLWLYSHWMPTLTFSMQSFKSLFSFGSKLLLSSLMHTLYVNLYTLIIGKRFASKDVGLYNRAFTLAQFPSSNLSTVIIRAIYPIQCQYKDDVEQLRSIFLKYLSMSCSLIFPMMVGLCVVAEPLVRIFLTDKWLPCVPFFQLMCIAFMFDPVTKINNIILSVKGHTDYFLYAEFIKKAVAFAILFASMPWGIIWMCAGLILYSIMDIVIIVHYSRKVINISLYSQLKTLMPIFVLSAIMGLAMYLPVMLFSSPFLQLCVGLIIGLVMYVVLSSLLHIDFFRQIRNMLAEWKQDKTH